MGYGAEELRPGTFRRAQGVLGTPHSCSGTTLRTLRPSGLRRCGSPAGDTLWMKGMKIGAGGDRKTHDRRDRSGGKPCSGDSTAEGETRNERRTGSSSSDQTRECRDDGRRQAWDVPSQSGIRCPCARIRLSPLCSPPHMGSQHWQNARLSKPEPLSRGRGNMRIK